MAEKTIMIAQTTILRDKYAKSGRKWGGVFLVTKIMPYSALKMINLRLANNVE